MEKKNYQFTQVPTNLFILLDNNCRSMLFTLIQLSSNYADEEGWFFRTYEDLEMESNLSKNLVEATIQTLFNHYLIEARPTGFGKGKKPNYYKVNFEEFSKYDEMSIENAMKNPDFKIRTVNYKGSNFKLNLVRDTVKETVTNVVTNTVKSDNNIYNIDNIYNKENIKNIYNKNNEKIEYINKEKIEINKNEEIEENSIPIIRKKVEVKKQFVQDLNETNLEKEESDNDLLTIDKFKAMVDENMKGETETELLLQRINLSKKLNSQRAILSPHTVSVSDGYLNSIYNQKLELAKTMTSTTDDEMDFLN